MKKDNGVQDILAGIIAAAVFLALYLGANWNIVLCIVLAVGVFAAAALLLRPTRKIGGIAVEELPNGEELARKLEEARADYRSIGKAVEKISDVELRADAERLQTTAGNLLKYLEKNPDRIPLARRFIDYYQDRASYLLGHYVELQETRLETQEARSLKDGTKKAVVILNDAFEKQFEKLMNNEMMDMDAEIGLIEKTMKMEGLS